MNRIARYNPTTDVWSALGSGVGSDLFALVIAFAVLPSGEVIVGGSFNTAGGVAANRIARYNPGAPAPSIIAQPLPVLTVPSSNAVFFVSATGGPGSGTPTYQWRHDGVALDTLANPAAATPVLSLTNVQAADLGSYDCLVTNSCGGTGTASNPAALTFVIDACPADINHDGIITSQDFFDFLAAFFAGC